MIITANVTNSMGSNKITVATEGNQKSIAIPSKEQGLGSSINGGELLFLSLATCFCNDVYREAAKRNIVIHKVNVTVLGTFGKEGEPASNITYQVNIDADCSQEEVDKLVVHVDTIAEVHNTLRKGMEVVLQQD